MKRAKQQFRTRRIAVIAVASLMLAAGIASLAEPGFAKRIVSGAWQNTANAFASTFGASSEKRHGQLALATAKQRGIVKGATTEDRQVSFHPESLTIPAGQTTGTINVTTYASPASSYDVHFTATGTINNAEVTKDYSATVKLLTTAACEIGDWKCEDHADECTVKCNDGSCYDGNGQLRCPRQTGCYTDLPACQNFKVLKVRKDRQCKQWLDCKSPVTVVNSETGRNQTQCTALGVCVSLGADGRCSQFITGTPADRQLANRVYQTPADVQGITSKIRWYSGYSTGFHFYVDPNNQRPLISGGLAPTDVRETGLNGATSKDLVKNGNFEELRCVGGPRDNKSCVTESDCRVGKGVCADTAEPAPAKKTSATPCSSNTDCAETGSDTPICRFLTAWGTDVRCKNPQDSDWIGVIPVAKGSKVCSNDATTSCATANDCPAATCADLTGQKFCQEGTKLRCAADSECYGLQQNRCLDYCCRYPTGTNKINPNCTGYSEASECATDDECGTTVGIGKCEEKSGQFCSTDLTKACPNGQSDCLAPTCNDVGTYETAGYGFSTSTNVDPGNIQQPNYYAGVIYGKRYDATSSQTVRWRVWEDDRANFVDQTARGGANISSAQFPLWSREKHVKDGNNVLRVEVESSVGGGYGVGVPVAAGDNPLLVGQDGYIVSFKFRYDDSNASPAPIEARLTLNYGRDTVGNTLGYTGTEGNNRNDKAHLQHITVGTIAGTTAWSQYVFGPITIPADAYNPGTAAMLEFVSAGQSNGAASTVFYLDDVSMKPSLETAKADLDAAKPILTPRGCRLFARDDSTDCQYSDDTGKLYKGWRGYCLDKDPNNANLCLTWWPLDILAGENPLGSTQQGYAGPSAVFQCLEQQASATVFDQTITDGSQIEDYWKPESLTTSIRWRDIASIDVLADFNDEKDGRSVFEDSWGGGCGDAVDGANMNCSDAAHRLYSLDLNVINRVSGDDGLRLFQKQFSVNFDETQQPWDAIAARPSDNNSTCPDSADDQYFAMLFHFNKLEDPDKSDATLDWIQAYLCDTRNGHLNGATLRVIIRARSSCNYVVQTVKPDENGDGIADQKTWSQRMRPGQYTDPKLGITYTSDAAPYGAISAPNNDPTTWKWSPGGDLNAQPSVMAASPAQGYNNVRAGVPYSYSDDPAATGNTTAKYCLASELPDGTAIGAETQAGNLCDTQANVTSCLNSGTRSCIGRPVKTCSGNSLYTCATDADCQSQQSGNCVGSADAGWSQGVHGADDAIKRIQHVFAQSFGCWQLQSKLLDSKGEHTDSPDACSSKGGCSVQSTYSSGCSSLSNGGVWNVYQDGHACPATGRPQVTGTNDDAAEYCFVVPTISNLTFGSATGGDITVTQNQPVVAQFRYAVDAQQGPALKYAVDWTRHSGESNTTDSCGTMGTGWQGIQAGSSASLAIPYNYTSTGVYQPRVCVKDSWGVVGQAMYNGTITATGS